MGVGVSLCVCGWGGVGGGELSVDSGGHFGVSSDTRPTTTGVGEQDQTAKEVASSK